MFWRTFPYCLWKSVLCDGDFMSNFIEAKQTSYRGYLMRSRLESRWAVFFDTLGIKWEYEFEGFDLSDGYGYLPDFYLPTFDNGCWCEVKPDGGDFSRAVLFAKDYEEKIWLCEGVPEVAIYKYADYKYPLGIRCGIPLWGEADGENRFYTQPCEFSSICGEKCNSNNKIPIMDKGIIALYFHYNNLLPKAILAAKQARFEHGETGLTHIKDILSKLV